MIVDPWAAFLEARKNAIHHFVAEGHTFAEIVSVLNLQDDEHARRIYRATEAREISDEAIKEAALAAGAAKFYPDAQSKKPWSEEPFLVTGGFLQRFVKAICANFPADVETIKKAARWQQSAPLDSCTDPYNCARCKAHPAHRQGLHHAGISSSSRKEDSGS